MMRSQIEKVTHEERIELARKICVEVKNELGEGLRAFVIFASTAKNADGPYSDLEMMAIVTDDYEEIACGFMRGDAYCEVYYVPFLKALKDAAKVDSEWPVSADQWHRMNLLYTKESDDCIAQIKSASLESLAAEEKFSKNIRWGMYGLREAVTQLMNAWERGVRSDASTYLYGFSYCVVKQVAFVNRYFYQSHRNAWEESKKLKKLPRDYVYLIEIIHGETEASLEKRYDASLELWQNILGWMVTMGVEWESEGKLVFPKRGKDAKSDA